MVRHEQPLCPNPYGKHDAIVESTTQVHHIISIEQAPHLAFERLNLCGVCNRCHEHLTTLERRKIDTSSAVRLALEFLIQHQMDRFTYDATMTHPTPPQGVSPSVSFSSKECQNAPHPTIALGSPPYPHRGVQSQKALTSPTGHGVLPSVSDKEGGGALHCVKSGHHFFCCRRECLVLTRCAACPDIVSLQPVTNPRS